MSRPQTFSDEQIRKTVLGIRTRGGILNATTVCNVLGGGNYAY